MEKYKNIDSIEEVNTVLRKFQQGYKSKTVDEVSPFVNEMFSDKAGLVVIGSGINQWVFNLEVTKKSLGGRK